MFKNDISDRIKSLFDSHSGKVNILLKEMAIPEPTFYRSLKSGVWKFEHIRSIARYFNVTIDWIADGKANDETETLKREIEQWKNTAKTFQKSLLELLKEKEYEEERIQS